ncbi:putative NTE family protein [Thalassocella blandensis]|nr:putative NTE family protein [Thalassocella blandensis]
MAVKFGLALGGGGVKGLAHIALLKQLDEWKIKPTLIAGSSMGAILGALYAHGLTGKEIEDRVRMHIIGPNEGVKETFRKSKHLLKWARVFSWEKSRGGLITADGLFEHLFSEIINLDFNDLDIAFKAIATDYHTGQEVVLRSGELLPAVRASMAVPGVFAPVKINTRLLIDGGVINNLPCDQVAGCGGKIIASDVISLPTFRSPSTLQVMSGALNIMIADRTRRLMQEFPPDFIFKPNTEGVDAFDFHKIADVLVQGQAAVDISRDSLARVLKI